MDAPAWTAAPSARSLDLDDVCDECGAEGEHHCRSRCVDAHCAECFDGYDCDYGEHTYDDDDAADERFDAAREEE